MKSWKFWAIVFVLSNAVWAICFISYWSKIEQGKQGFEDIQLRPRVKLFADTDSIRPGKPFGITALPYFEPSQQVLDIEQHGGSRHLKIGDSPDPNNTELPAFWASWVALDSLFLDSVRFVVNKARVVFPLSNRDTLIIWDSLRVPISGKQ